MATSFVTEKATVAVNHVNENVAAETVAAVEETVADVAIVDEEGSEATGSAVWLTVRDRVGGRCIDRRDRRLERPFALAPDRRRVHR